MLSMQKPFALLNLVVVIFSFNVHFHHQFEILYIAINVAFIRANI